MHYLFSSGQLLLEQARDEARSSVPGKCLPYFQPFHLIILPGVLVKFITFLLAITAAGIVLPVTAARADTLAEAVARAYERNPELQGNRALTRAADEVVTQAQGAYGPSLSVNASHEYTVRRTTLESRSVDDRGSGTTVAATLSQPLFTSGRLAAALDAAKAGRMVARANLRALSQQLILDVISAYASLQRDIALFDVATEIHALLQQQRDVTLARFNLRDSTQPDLDQTNSRLQIAAGRVIAARAAVENSAARYRNVVGVYPERLEPLPSLPGLPGLPSLDVLYARAETNNPMLAAAKFTEYQSRSAVAAARAEMGPEVTAFSTAQRAPLTPFRNSDRTESITAGVSLFMPLYSGGRLPAAVREAVQRNFADQQFVEQARRDLRESLANNWSRSQAAAEALPRFEAAVSAAERAVSGVKQQETAGIRTLRDVLDVTNDLLAARTSAAETRAELYIRKAAVLRDAGLLSIELFSDQPRYDPDSYYPAAASLAGLPLRPVIAPIDRLLLDKRVPPVPVDREDAAVFNWSNGKDAVLPPPP